MLGLLIRGIIIQHEYHDLRTIVLSLLPPWLYLLFTRLPAQNTNKEITGATVAPWKCVFRDYTHTHTHTLQHIVAAAHTQQFIHACRPRPQHGHAVERLRDCRGERRPHVVHVEAVSASPCLEHFAQRVARVDKSLCGRYRHQRSLLLTDQASAQCKHFLNLAFAQVLSKFLIIL